MSDRLISISIDVTLLNKSRFVPGKKANSKGVAPQYVNLDVKLLDEPKFDNNYIVTERATKEERASKKKMQIVGNGRTIFGPDERNEQRGQDSERGNTDRY